MSKRRVEKMKIILAKLEHLEHLVPLFNGYRMFYQQKSDLDGVKEFLKQRLIQRDSIIFFAKDEAKALGFTQLYPTYSSVSLERFYILNDIFVLPERRGQEIGESLLKYAQEFVTKAGLKGLSLETAVENPAKKLYEKLGWKCTNAEFLHYFWKRPET